MVATLQTLHYSVRYGTNEILIFFKFVCKSKDDIKLLLKLYGEYLPFVDRKLSIYNLFFDCLPPSPPEEYFMISYSKVVDFSETDYIAIEDLKSINPCLSQVFSKIASMNRKAVTLLIQADEVNEIGKPNQIDLNIGQLVIDSSVVFGNIPLKLKNVERLQYFFKPEEKTKDNYAIFNTFKSIKVLKFYVPKGNFDDERVSDYVPVKFI